MPSASRHGLCQKKTLKLLGDLDYVCAVVNCEVLNTPRTLMTLDIGDEYYHLSKLWQILLDSFPVYCSESLRKSSKVSSLRALTTSYGIIDHLSNASTGCSLHEYAD